MGVVDPIPWIDKESGNQVSAAELNTIVDKVNEIALAPIFTELLFASSTATQTPSGSGVPLQVEFGPAQGTGSDPVQIDASGNITFNQAGTYRVTVIVTPARDTSSGVALLLLRALINASQIGNAIGIEMDDDDTTLALQFSIELNGIVATDVLTFEFARDEDGNDSGELRGITPTGALSGWGATPSATIRIFEVFA